MTVNKSLLLLTLAFAIIACKSQTPHYRFNKDIENLAKDDVSKQYPILAWEYSYIGEYSKSLKSFDDYYRITGQTFKYPEISLPEDYTLRDAREYIISRSAEEKMVILNEAHHQPMHRVFTESLLEGLYKNGFRYLALEGLVSDSRVNETKILTLNDGYYTREPQFGNLISQAVALGYHVFGYEYTGTETDRESGQAQNIRDVLSRDPGAKILIHCGVNHLVEEKHPSGIRTMAQRLKELTRIDPLTVDQVMFSEHSDRDSEHPLYSSFDTDQPAVLLDKEQRVISLNGETSLVDVRVVHPRTKFIHSRPHWLYRNGTWKSHYPSDLTVKFPCRILAYKGNTLNRNNVPADIIELNSPHEKALVLPRGLFSFYVIDSRGVTQIIHSEVK